MKNFWVKYVTCISYIPRGIMKVIYNETKTPDMRRLRKNYIENSLDYYMASDIICNEGFEIK